MSQINQKELQSYFESICNSFYIVYKELKRLEKEEEELEETAPHMELEVIDKLLQVPEQDECWQKYVTQKYSKEELQRKKEELEQAFEEYNSKSRQLSCVKKSWERNYKCMRDSIQRLCVTLKENDLTIIVTCKEEITALMYFFREYEVSQYRVINIEEKALKSFPTAKNKYKEFYKAYCLEDDEEMKNLCRKYF